MANGLRYVYTGNVRDTVGGATLCPGCGAVVVGRDGYEITAWQLESHLDTAACSACGTRIPGRFEPRPGTWGARRRPVRLSTFAP